MEKEPLGNAGALFFLDLKEDFLLLNADAAFDVDFNRMLNFHRQNGALATIFTHPNSHPYDSGVIFSDKCKRVVNWLTKEDDRPIYYKNRVNAGLHIISPKALELCDIQKSEIVNGKMVDFDRDILKPLCRTGLVFCYDSPEYVKDMGTPERIIEVEEDYKNGIVVRKNLKNKQRAVFLDRDGTINKYVGFLRKEEEFELLPGVIDAIKKINQSGYLAIVITNQPIIARGEATFAELEIIHNKMETLLGKEGAFVDSIYFCPHHPHLGYEGEIKELKIDCNCRKPKPGMILKAASDWNIDLEQSYMVGDSENDIKAGKAAGCKTVLLTEEIADFDQDISVNGLKDFVDKYLR